MNKGCDEHYTQVQLTYPILLEACFPFPSYLLGDDILDDFPKVFATKIAGFGTVKLMQVRSRGVYLYHDYTIYKYQGDRINVPTISHLPGIAFPVRIWDEKKNQDPSGKF